MSRNTKRSCVTNKSLCIEFEWQPHHFSGASELHGAALSILCQPITELFLIDKHDKELENATAGGVFHWGSMQHDHAADRNRDALATALHQKCSEVCSAWLRHWWEQATCLKEAKTSLSCRGMQNDQRTKLHRDKNSNLPAGDFIEFPKPLQTITRVDVFNIANI